jgi:hypothetical protein
MKQNAFHLLVVALASAVNLLAGTAFSQTDVVQAAKDAGKTFQPIAPQEVAVAKAELQAAVADLDALLKRSKPEYDAGWRKFLRWDDLQSQLRPEGPDTKNAEAVLDKLSANAVGLETSRFARVRHALRNYLNMATADADAKLQDTYGTQLTDLAAKLESYDKTSAGDDALAINRALGWLRRGRQAAQLVDAVQAKYSKPNLVGTVSQHFLAAGIEEDIEQTQPVSDNILGTSLSGTAHMVGRTRVEIPSNEQQAQFDILLTGQANSNTVGYNGPVTIYSTGATTISGRKSLYMNDLGLTATPAAANCATASSINGISARCRLIEKIAWKKAGQQQGQAEQIASSHAAWRVQGQMDDRAANLIANANKDWVEKVRNPLARRDGLPRSLRFRSQPDKLQMIALEQSPMQLGAPSDPPAPKMAYDVTLQAHESAVVNYGEAILGGVTLTDERLEKIIRDDLAAEVPEELKITPDKDPWSITFTNEVPVRAVFGAETVSLALRGRRFTRGDQAINEPIDISAVYKVEKTDKGTKLTRQGEVVVKFLNRERLGAPQIAFKTFLTRKFEALFKPEIVSDGIVLRGQLAKAGKLRIQEMTMGKGWAVLGWNLVPPTTPGVTEAPAQKLGDKVAAE